MPSHRLHHHPTTSPRAACLSRARARGGLAALLLLLASSPAQPQSSRQAVPKEATLTPLAAANFAGPSIPEPEQLREAGWTPVEERVPLETVTQPRIPLQQGVAWLTTQPARLPRPTARMGAKPVPLPLAADPELLQRREEEAGALIAWTPRVELRRAGGSAWVLDVDVRPFQLEGPPDQSDVQSAFKHAERRLAAAPLAPTGTLQANPSRRFRLEKSAEPPAPVEEASNSGISALQGDTATDALLVSLDDGRSWWAAALGEAPEASERHVLDATKVFVDEGRILLAPRPRAPDAALELLAFRPPSTEAESIPFPRPTDAPWRCELSDLRRREGQLEALVLVHDPRLRRAPEEQPASSWGAYLRQVDGRWHELERLPLPGDARALRLLFDGMGPACVLTAGERLLGRRALAAN